MSVGPDQHGAGSGDGAEHRELPSAGVFGADQLDPIGPGGKVDGAGLAEVDERRPGIVQEREDSHRALGGVEVKVGHAAAEQLVSLPEVVLDVQTGQHPGEPLARLIHAEQLGHAVAQCVEARVGRGG